MNLNNTTGAYTNTEEKNASHHIVKNLIIYDFGRSKMFRLSLPDLSHRSLCTDDILKTMGTKIFFSKNTRKITNRTQFRMVAPVHKAHTEKQ